MMTSLQFPSLQFHEIYQDASVMAAADDEEEQNPFLFSKFVESKNSFDLLGKSGSINTGVEGFGTNNETDQDGLTQKKSQKRLLIIDDDTASSQIYSEAITEKKRNHYINNDNDSDDEFVQESDDDDDDDNESFDSESSLQSASYMIPSAQQDSSSLKLSYENETLRQQIAKMKEEFLQYRLNANKRISNLQKDLEKTRQKEADETKALEDVVRMVESNLQTTKARALRAETTVNRLKEEIKLLKQSSVPSSQYGRLLEEHNSLVQTVNEKARGAASLMRSAAEKTEPHIRQLQSGVSSLYFLAEQFDNISKVTELHTDNTNS